MNGRHESQKSMLGPERLERRTVFAGDALSAVVAVRELPNDAICHGSDAPPRQVNAYDAGNHVTRVEYGYRLEPSPLEKLGRVDFICTYDAHHGARPPYDKEVVEDTPAESEQCHGSSGESSYEVGGSVSEVLIEYVDTAPRERIIDHADGDIELVYMAAPASSVPLRQVMFVTYAYQLPDGTWGFECRTRFFELCALPLEQRTEALPRTCPEGTYPQRKPAPTPEAALGHGDEWSAKSAAFASLTDITAEDASLVRGRRRVQR